MLQPISSVVAAPVAAIVTTMIVTTSHSVFVVLSMSVHIVCVCVCVCGGGPGWQKSNAGDTARTADNRKDAQLLRDSRRRAACPQHVTWPHVTWHPVAGCRPRPGQPSAVRLCPVGVEAARRRQLRESGVLDQLEWFGGGCGMGSNTSRSLRSLRRAVVELLHPRTDSFRPRRAAGHRSC